MRFRPFRLLVFAACLLGLLIGAMGFAILWAERGPGLRNEVNRLAAVMQLRPGMTAAEIGAGYGRMAVEIAQRLGVSGRLYASELPARKIEAIRRAASAAGLGNITVIPAGEHSANLPDSCCDIIYMRRVYHHLSDAAAINRTLYAALRPGGRLVIIDFVTPRWMFFLRHGIPSGVLAGQVTAAGFVLERQIGRWSPIDYCIVFRKPTYVAAPPWISLVSTAARASRLPDEPFAPVTRTSGTKRTLLSASALTALTTAVGVAPRALTCIS